jgi:hypothetical protein
MSGTRILWVDDDALGLLAPVGRELTRCGCLLQTAIDLEEAMQKLQTPRHQSYSTLLADVVLPRRQVAPGVSRDLGLGLAETAASAPGMQRIAFLTVFSWNQLKVRIESLQQRYTGIQFQYFSKAELLGRGRMQDLSNFLRVRCSERPQP